jgi:hypothetical protein
MKLLLPLLLLSVSVSAQQDFDYALYTRHSQCPVFLNKDSSMVELSLERRIVKEGSRLTISPCMNTGNTQEYHIHFEGFSTHPAREPMNKFFWHDSDMTALEYSTEDLKFNITIWPLVPLLEIHEFGSGKLYDRYY